MSGLVGVLLETCETDLYGHCQVDSLSYHHLNWNENPVIEEGSIVLRTLGRLGNQLFQYAAAFNLAEQTQSKLYVFVDLGYADSNLLVNKLTAKSNPTPDRNYYLTDFNLSHKATFVPINEKTVNLYSTFFKSDAYRKCVGSPVTINNKQFETECVREENFHFISKKTNNKILIASAFFEKQAYFDQSYPSIVEQFKLKNPDTKSIDSIITEISKKK